MRPLEKHRQSKPLDELYEKARKASRKGIWTQEEIDYAFAKGDYLWRFFNANPAGTKNRKSS